MNVIALTTFIGLALVGLAIAFFVHQTNSASGGEQDALMPLDEEGVCKAVSVTASPRTPPTLHFNKTASHRKSEFP